MIPRSLRIAVFVLACGVVTYLSLVPGPALPPVTFWDKAEHMLAYVGLALLGAAAFPFAFTRVAGGLFLYGVAIEGLQALMNLGRQGDPMDVVANSLGIATGLLVALAIREAVKVKSRAAGE